jgi:hypothetical protein
MGVMADFGVAQVPATLGLTLYVAGYGLGPLIWSPMSEIPQIGRLWVYIITLRKCSYPVTKKKWHANNDINSGLRPSSDSHCPVRQLRHASRFPILDWILRFASTCDRRCFYRRHVPTQETSVWSSSLGNWSCMRSRSWSPRWWLCRHGRRLDVDHLGDHVALRLLLGFPVLLPAGDKRAQHPAPQDTEAQEADR